jgi:hypothetical protein
MSRSFCESQKMKEKFIKLCKDIVLIVRDIEGAEKRYLLDGIIKEGLRREASYILVNVIGGGIFKVEEDFPGEETKISLPLLSKSEWRALKDLLRVSSMKEPWNPVYEQLLNKISNGQDYISECQEDALLNGFYDNDQIESEDVVNA